MSLPTVTITPEKASQKSMTGSVRSVHQTSFLWALLKERRIVTAGRSSYCSQWDAMASKTIERLRPPALAPIHGAFASLIAAAGGFW